MRTTPAQNRADDGIDISWWHGGHRVNGSVREKYTILADNLRLVMSNVRRDANPNFECRVRNDAGEARAQFRMNVVVPPRIISDDPDEEEFRPKTFVEVKLCVKNTKMFAFMLYLLFFSC